jgi:predicted NBD/HSP70 family sugar kinase
LDSSGNDTKAVRAAPGLGARASGLRRHNLSTILERLHLTGATSRSELSNQTGLNRSTIADLVQELASTGLVVEEGVSTSTGPGRPSPIVHVRPSSATVIAVELAVDSVAVAMVGLGGHVYGQVRADQPRGRLTPEETVQEVVDLVRPLRAALPHDHLVAGVGVAVAGLTRRSDGFVQLAPNLGWRGVPVGAMLAEALGQPHSHVHVANEADLGALGEHRRGAGRTVDNLVFVSSEVGIGAGLIIGGRPMLGAAGYAGEAGHTLVRPEGRRCQCGARGCWETEAGEAAILQRAGVTPEVSGLTAVDVLIDRLEAGDPQALAAAAETAWWLGIGIGNLINMLNPEVVIIGGLYHRLFRYIRSPVLAAVNTSGLDAVKDIATIVPSELGASAALIGAAELSLSEIIADPVGHRGQP